MEPNNKPGEPEKTEASEPRLLPSESDPQKQADPHPQALPESALNERPDAAAGRRERRRRHKASILRRLELLRLKRIRKHSTPTYRHCKNCGETLQGMYCHRCGQYALDIEQPFWKYFKQYFENVYQFDSKVWQTLLLLFRRPGFLTLEFNAGKINSYVHPLRLFMFISALFFAFSFLFIPDSYSPWQEGGESAGRQGRALSDLRSPEVVRSVERLIQDGTIEEDEFADVLVVSPREAFRGLETIVRMEDIPGRDTLRVHLPRFLIDEGYLVSPSQDSIYWSYEDPHMSVAAKRLLEEQQNLKKEMAYMQIVGWFSKWLPILMLMLIPLFAMILKFFFRKQRKKYMWHFVLALHFHSVLLILVFGIILSKSYLDLSPADARTGLIVSLLYLFFSLRRVYGNGWIKTALKTLLIYFVYCILLLLIFSTTVALVALPYVKVLQ